MFYQPSAQGWLMYSDAEEKRKGDFKHGSRFNETIIGIRRTFWTRNTSLES